MQKRATFPQQNFIQSPYISQVKIPHLKKHKKAQCKLLINTTIKNVKRCRCNRRSVSLADPNDDLLPYAFFRSGTLHNVTRIKYGP